MGKAMGTFWHSVISITKIIDWSTLVAETPISGEMEPSQSATSPLLLSFSRSAFEPFPTQTE